MNSGRKQCHDLFGQAVKRNCIPVYKKEPGRFDLENDLSPAERFVVARFMVQSARLEANPDLSFGIVAEADRYGKCGHEAVGLVCPDCHKQYFVRSYCRSRICERCGRIYKKDLMKSILPVIKQQNANKKRGYVLSMLTLTISSKRYNEYPGRTDIKRFYEETSEFFRLHYGKFKGRYSKNGKVVENRKRFIGAGWLATIEVGSGKNLHCHAIIYGPIRNWFGLKSSWEKITGDSQGVHIKKIGSIKQVANYVLKYITKPTQTEEYSEIAAYVGVIKGSRRLRAGGIFYNRFKILKKKKYRSECIYCNARLIMETMLDLAEKTERIDLFTEMRNIEQENEKTDISINVPVYLGPTDISNERKELQNQCNLFPMCA